MSGPLLLPTWDQLEATHPHVVATMRASGPDAPTLCEGWTTRDLAAHLVIRERRLDATPGILVPQLAGYTAKVQEQVTAATDWTALVELFSFLPGNGNVDAATAKVLRCKYSGDEDLLDVEGWEEADDLWRGVVVGGGVMR